MASRGRLMGTVWRKRLISSPMSRQSAPVHLPLVKGRSKRVKVSLACSSTICRLSRSTVSLCLASLARASLRSTSNAASAASTALRSFLLGSLRRARPCGGRSWVDPFNKHSQAMHTIEHNGLMKMVFPLILRNTPAFPRLSSP